MIARARSLLTHAVVLASLVLATHTFVALGWLRPVEVVGDSMAPSLAAGERLVVRRWADPRPWDLVVVRSPEDARRLLVKRVIGMPGESLSLRGGDVWIDGAPLPRRNPGDAAGVYYGAFGSPTWRLGADEWFVAGDNQRASVDSRHWGPVRSKLIVGVVRR